MSSNRNVYVGMYLVVPKVGQEVELEPTYECVKDTTHKIPKEAKFCPTCGKQIHKSMRTVHKDVPLIPYNISYVGDDFWIPEYFGDRDGKSIWLDNTDTNGDIEVKDSPVEITPSFITDQKINFTNKYVQLIERIEKDYDVRIEIKFGVVAYWS